MVVVHLGGSGDADRRFLERKFRRVVRARRECGGVFGTPDDDFTMTVDDEAIFDVRVRVRVLFGEPSIEIIDE